MRFPVALAFCILCLAFISFASSLETNLRETELGYRCGNVFFRDAFLEKVKKKPSSKTEYHGHIDFGENAYKVPIPGSESLPFPNYIIMNRANSIISVISPYLVDASVDSDEDTKFGIFNIEFPETYMNYRKCEESPTLSSISSSVGGFVCGKNILRTQDAIKAAYLARKMHKKNKTLRPILFKPRPYPRPYNGPFKFDHRLPKYTLPLTAEGNFNVNGQIFIILDGYFNVIGAMLRETRKYTECTQTTYTEPIIIGQETVSEQEIESYKCNVGFFAAWAILGNARVARKIFRAKELSPEMEYPKLYTGTLFPKFSEPLYYIPVIFGELSTTPTFIVMTRSCDVTGLIQESSTGFRLCKKRSQQQQSESILMPPTYLSSEDTQTDSRSSLDFYSSSRLSDRLNKLVPWFGSQSSASSRSNSQSPKL